jgi:nickel transport system ATP-binding protein
MPQKIQLEQISPPTAAGQRRLLHPAPRAGAGAARQQWLRKIADLRRRAGLPPGVRQTAGRVLLDGIPVHGEQLRGATIATIMQNPRSAFNPQTMAAHARETCRAAGREANDAVLLAAMEEVGLDNPRALLKRYPLR